MAKSSSQLVYLCNACGADFPKWYGQCPACHEWGTLSEFTVSGRKSKSSGNRKTATAPAARLSDHRAPRRYPTRIGEVDRVLGGGLLSGALVLIGGNPGIGKSTLAIQILHACGVPALYISAEESPDQVAMRAKRLKITAESLWLSGEAEIDAIEDAIRKEKPELVVIDSIQTVYNPDLDSLPGSVGQIRDCAQRLLQLAKSISVTILIIGHVTKEGVIAGPRMLEHMVDTVLYLEGDERHNYRILRAVKNRFGATHEVGVFQMDATGLTEVTNPSELFLQERLASVPGSAIYPSLEGTRPILVEVQALVTVARFGTPQRNVNGLDYRRLAMLLAVLEKRMNLTMGNRDVFVNLVGGLRVDDPAIDLAVLAAVASSARDIALPERLIFIGEVGLAGEVRSVSQLDKRLREALSLGFESAIIPFRSQLKANLKGLKLIPVRSVRDVMNTLFPG
ncbi:MAG: DNA repair protein RadA [FCB group bacterium]|nr:DNA repair protein RadA [FCB group bacterium]